jgi:hypothetical protein
VEWGMQIRGITWKTTKNDESSEKLPYALLRFLDFFRNLM